MVLRAKGKRFLVLSETMEHSTYFVLACSVDYSNLTHTSINMTHEAIVRSLNHTTIPPLTLSFFSPSRTQVWTPAGGWWTNPRNWQRNTGICAVTIGFLCANLFAISAQKERRPMPPYKPIPSQRWAKYAKVDDPSLRQIKYCFYLGKKEIMFGLQKLKYDKTWWMILKGMSKLHYLVEIISVTSFKH